MSQMQGTKSTIEAIEFLSRLLSIKDRIVVISFDHVERSTPFYLRVAAKPHNPDFPWETSPRNWNSGIWSAWYLEKGQAEVERISVERSIVKEVTTVHLNLIRI